MQLNIESSNAIFEWIPYDQFRNIEETSKDELFVIYSAIWINGPLVYNKDKGMHNRIQNEKVFLKCLYDSQNHLDNFLYEVL